LPCRHRNPVSPCIGKVERHERKQVQIGGIIWLLRALLPLLRKLRERGGAFRGRFFYWINNFMPLSLRFFCRLHRSVYQAAFKFKISYLTQQPSACVRLSDTSIKFLTLKFIDLNQNTN
jgi:hypothetical protein